MPKIESLDFKPRPMNTPTLGLTPDQLRAILKQAIISDPTLVKEVLNELKEEGSVDKRFDQAVDDIFKQYDDVFKALA
jgi:hypothetical protein